MSEAINPPEVKLVPWWLVLIEGILLIIIGIFLLTRPIATWTSLVWVIGLYWLISGIFNIIKIFFDRSMWGWKLFAGIVGIIAGYFLVTTPFGGTIAFTAAVVLVLGLFGIFIGIVNLIQAFKGAGWGTGILGIVSIILGIIILANQQQFMWALPWAAGILAIFGGILAIFNAFRIRSAKKDLEEAADAAKARAASMPDAAAVRTPAAAAATAGAVAAMDEDEKEEAAEAVAEAVEEADDVEAAKAAVAAAAVSEAVEEAEEDAEAEDVDESASDAAKAAAAIAAAAAVSEVVEEDEAEEAEEEADDQEAKDAAAKVAAAAVVAEAVAETEEEADEEEAEEAAAKAAAAAAVAAAASEAAEEADEAEAEEGVRLYGVELEPDEELSAQIADQFPGLSENQVAGLSGLVAAVRSLDVADAEKLRQIGITKADQLLEAGASRPGRAGIAKETSIDESTVLKWINDLDLKRIDGIGVKYSDLLETAGVDTVVELAHRNPTNLYKKLVEVNEAEHVVEMMPTEDDVSDWVAQAKQLPRVITY